MASKSSDSVMQTGQNCYFVAQLGNQSTNDYDAPCSHIM